MSNSYSKDLLGKYRKINYDFQQAGAADFIKSEVLEVMLNNFQRDEQGDFLLNGDKRIITGACDVWSLFIKIDNKELKNFIYQKAKDILNCLKNKKIFLVKPETYHISIALLHDLRPSDMKNKNLLNTRLNKQQVETILKIVKPIINNYPAFSLKLYGLSMSITGSLTAVFIDRGEYLKLQSVIADELNKVSYIPKRKYKKDIIHITLARILEPVGNNLLVELKERMSNFYDLSRLNFFLNVDNITLAHEIRWMHEELELNSKKSFQLKIF